jgi:hypothetical protein
MGQTKGKCSDTKSSQQRPPPVLSPFLRERARGRVADDPKSSYDARFKRDCSGVPSANARPDPKRKTSDQVVRRRPEQITP